MSGKPDRINWGDLELAYEPNKTIVIIFDNRRNNLQNIDVYYQKLKDMFGDMSVRWTKYTIELNNRSKIMFFSAGQHRALRGLFVDRIIYVNKKLFSMTDIYRTSETLEGCWKPHKEKDYKYWEW